MTFSPLLFGDRRTGVKKPRRSATPAAHVFSLTRKIFFFRYPKEIKNARPENLGAGAYFTGAPL